MERPPERPLERPLETHSLDWVGSTRARERGGERMADQLIPVSPLVLQSELRTTSLLPSTKCEPIARPKIKTRLIFMVKI